MPPKKKARVSNRVPKQEKASDEVNELARPKAEYKDGGGGGTEKYWLMKAEPGSRIENGVDVKFGIDDLMKEPDQTACWDGVRNYQARNFMRDEMKIGDLAFFYHSNCKPPGVAGVMRIVKEGYVDHTQFDPKAAYYDAKSSKDKPKWHMVDVKFERKLKRYLPLPEIKGYHLEHKSRGGPLEKVALFTKARLSVQPLSKEEFEFIKSLEDSNGD